MQQPHDKEMLKLDKKYSFQTSDYVLFTPETYWYPRPGTGYSDKSPDWQQTYFSRFRLDVKPLPGLVAISQSANNPYQSISLIIGKYEQKSVESDSTLYSIWHIKGHDYYEAAFDSIRDTIPGLIRNLRENLERTYKLSYPFDRFSVVEVPAPFLVASAGSGAAGNGSFPGTGLYVQSDGFCQKQEKPVEMVEAGRA